MTNLEYCKLVVKLEKLIEQAKDGSHMFNKFNLKGTLCRELSEYFPKNGELNMYIDMLHSVSKMTIMVIIAGGKFDENRYIQLLQKSHYLDDSYLLENLVVNEYHYSVDKLCYYINKFINDYLEIDDLTVYDVLNECASQFVDDSYIPSYKK